MYFYMIIENEYKQNSTKNAITRIGKPQPKDRCMKLKSTNAYKRKGVQKVHARRFETSQIITSNVGYRQNENI